MTKKRWVAIVVAVSLFFIWAMAGSSSKTISSNKKNELALSQDKLKEVTVGKEKGSNKIVILEINGTIASGGGESLLASPTYNHQFFMAQLKAIEKDKHIKGIVLEINTPGGGVYESSEIAKELKLIQDEHNIPIYVAMKGMAASGGYYVAANADKIFAAEETMTGSIGVIMSGLNMSGLFEKMGISDETIKSGELKDMGSSSRSWTEQDREVFQEMIDGSYERFVEIVAKGRELTKEEVRELADGRIYDGAQAQAKGLVDEIGFPEDAMAALRKDKKLELASVVKYEAPRSSLTDTLTDTWLGSQTQKLLGQKPSEAQLLASVLQQFGSSEAPRMMYLYGGE